jgi:hypothetical protein
MSARGVARWPIVRFFAVYSKRGIITFNTLEDTREQAARSITHIAHARASMVVPYIIDYYYFHPTVVSPCRIRHHKVRPARP